ncbi:MAG TPA: TraR/DksA C4-type zinc finger protein [Planctomycetota bacterium]|nr:TraR/DksA C4-type zinc finger protein [Planctomycetota bacterium]
MSKAPPKAAATVKAPPSAAAAKSKGAATAVLHAPAKKAGAASATVARGDKKVGGASTPAAINREKAPVKDGGRDGKAIAPVKVAVAKGAKEPLAKGRDGKVVKEAAKDAGKGVAKDAKGKPVKGKVLVPPPPPRKIQVVQLSTLKPGARGSRTVLARRPEDGVEKSQTNGGAKKRRSAELTTQQLDHFRELLEQRRHRLSSDLTLMQDEALKVTGQDNSADSVADAGTDNYEQDFTLGLIESEEALAREVDEALVRLEQAAFGVCETCETPIPLARLEILPFTRYCVECQQKREGQG